MLFRFISRRYHFRLPILPSHQTHLSNPTKPPINLSRIPPFPSPTFKFFPRTSQFFSTNKNHGNSPLNPGPDIWKLSSETGEAVFGEDSGSLEGMGEGGGTDGQTSSGNDGSWLGKSSADDTEGDIFRGVEDGKGMEGGGIDLPGGNDDGWGTVEPWDLGGDGKEEVNVFDINEGELEELHGIRDDEGLDGKKKEEDKLLEMEEKSLTAVLKGPNRAFGDLIAASGITEAMMDSLIALKDFENIEGLPPLSEIEDIRYEKNIKKSTRAEIERQKQEEVAKSRVRQVDTKGRAYGTGKRKCSIARVWIQPGDGKFIVNDKQFDVYFPMLDHRAALLRPFSETKTLGLWDVNCTVKGGGVSGQVGAILLGISRAMQNWEPELRPPLRSAGFLTRDSRVVERKKPGKAKARKSFQWVKR